MKPPNNFLAWPFGLILCLAGLTGVAMAQPSFTGIQRLTNQEILLRLGGATGVSYRIEASTNLPEWNGMLTLFSTGVTTYTDSAAPFLSRRFFRAQQLTGTNHVTGDHLVTTNGDVVIHPLYHASFVMTWNGRTIYNDPDDDPQFAARYLGLPKADLILISHSHGDHYSSNQIAAVRGSNAVIVVPQDVYNQNSFVPFRNSAIVLSYGASTNVMGLTVQAVAGYNGNHPFGINNAYVITIGGRRIFTSGDTGDVPEIRALTNISVAFLCMNLPFTTNYIGATNMIRAMRPAVVYPYHYRDSGNTYTNPPLFKQALGRDLGIEVRLRNWY